MDTTLQVQRVHLIGAGGIGVSSLAQYFLAHGVTVSGSDQQSSKQTELLIQKGATIYIGSNEAIITKEIEILIYSPAVPKEDPERVAARALGILELSYPQALGILSKQIPFTIAVSGTNGKTTTTTMITELLDHLAYRPTAIIGEVSQKFHTNYIHGDDHLLVTEACEYKDSFLNIHHNIVVVTNITEDHLDYFDDLQDIQDSFVSFINNTKEQGVLVCNIHDPHLLPVVTEAKKRDMHIIDYTTYLPEVVVSVPGEHNRYNACAALGVMEALGCDMHEAKTYLATSFKGAFRRFQYLGVSKGGAYVYDDYAHNPEGITLLSSALRTLYPDKHLVMLFEPHLYSRTRDLQESFVEALTLVDEVYLFETYRAREPYCHKEAFLLFDALIARGISVHKVTQPEHIVADLQKKYDEHTVIVSAGAGDIYQHTHNLIEE